MAYLLPFFISILIFILASPSWTLAISFQPSSVASSQLKFWSENVDGDMPKSLLSKLSPLSIKDMEYFSTLVSKNSLKADAKFCSLANVACSATNLVGCKNSYSSYAVEDMSPKVDQIDANSFFRVSILRKGNRVHLPNLRDQFPSRSFLPTQIASKLPIMNNIKDIGLMFPEIITSTAAKDIILSTLATCNAPELKGEIKGCLKSLNEMVGFAKNVLGQKHVLALVSNSAKGSGSELEIGEIKQFDAQKLVSCHDVFFPFVTYYCHLLSSTRLYKVDLIEVETRAPVNSILAMCHMDTSPWSASHAAFHVLKSSPGHTEACHWFTQLDLVWLAK